MILFDTNIFIDMLNGVREATIELGNYDSPAISVITYMELRAGEVLHLLDAPILNAILAEFEIIAVSREVTEAAISIPGNSLVNGPKINLPNCIIAATARVCSVPLVTRNVKDFTRTGIAVHIPYEYDASTGVVSNIQPRFSNFLPTPTPAP